MKFLQSMNEISRKEILSAYVSLLPAIQGWRYKF